MKHCAITYEVISEKENYSKKGLALLSPKLKNLMPLELNAAELRQEAIARAGKMSIQGVQAKLSAQLSIKNEMFELVDQFGHYILKPQSDFYTELPENEAITMTLAAKIGLEVPVHGLLYSKDNSMTYFIKRFDRLGHLQKLPIEDFAQLMGLSRETKYRSSMEKIIEVIITFCSFPKIELAKLFKLTLFNFLIGNEDMHIKNFSLITKNQITSLSPAYDLVNSTIAIRNPTEEMALTLNGKKRKLNKNDLLIYLAHEKMDLNEKTISLIINQIKQTIPDWKKLISDSFLSTSMQQQYLQLLEERCQRLDF